MDSFQAGADYRIATALYGWELNYGYTAQADGTGSRGSFAYYTDEGALLKALENLSLSGSKEIRIRYMGEGQPEEISQALLRICAQKRLDLEFRYEDSGKETLYTWKLEEIPGDAKALDLGLSVQTDNGDLPPEFLERSYIQVSSKASVPAGTKVSLTIGRDGIAKRFAGTELLCLWRRTEASMELLENPADYDRSGGNWVSFELGGVSEGESYVLSVQGEYGWQRVPDKEDADQTRMVYIENRSGKRVKGWEIVDGRKCCFDQDGYLYEGPAKVDGVWYLFGSWAEKNGNQGILTGYQSYQNHTYYANADGALQKGWQRISDKNGTYIWHYFSQEEDTFGEELPSEQAGFWVTMKEGAGAMAGRRYYFRNNTALLKNWQTIDGKRYFFMPGGYAAVGWYPNSTDKNVYYLNEQGQMQTGYTEVTENGRTAHYFFHTNGVRQYGWQRSLNEDKEYIWHYFHADASSQKYAYGQEIPSEHTGDYWYTMEGDTYYFRNNARLATGWQTIAVNGVNCRFYFDSTGKMQKGTQKIGSAFYHFRTDEGFEGVLGTGLFTDGGKTYYANTSGVLQRGWKKIDGIWRFFNHDTGEEEEGAIGSDYWASVKDENGKAKIFYFISGTRIATGWQTIEGRRYYFDANGILQTGFFKVGSNTYYGREAEDLKQYPGEAAAGEQVIGGDTYYFGTNYVMYTGWKKIDGIWRFFSMAKDSPKRGQEQKTSAPVPDGSWYWYTVNGEKYCFRNNSTLLKNWQTINGQRYYLDPSTGAAAVGKTLKVGKYTYCFDAQGVMQKNTIVDGYGYNSNGYRVKGWQKIENEWHYFSAVSGEPDDWREVESERDGYWVTLKYGTEETGDAGRERYYFRNNASLVKGWQNIDGKRYYFDTKTGVLQTGDPDGLYTIGKNTYYLGQDGALRYGWIRENEDGSEYYANTSGVLLSGWQKIDNLWYYFSTVTRKRDTSAYVDDDYFAYATENGTENTYYFTNGTSLAKNWQTIKGLRYYFDSVTGILRTGFFQVGRTWYYYEEDRTVKTGWWENPNTGNVHYFNGKGVAVTGWQTIDGSRYYFDANSVMQTQKVKIGNTTYFFGPDGKMRTGFVKYCDTTYYFHTNGQMRKGWQTIGGQRYYFDTEGAMQTGFVTIGRAVYYFDEGAASRGQMRKGVQSIRGKSYYFNNSGAQLYGWQKIDYVWRFFDLTTGAELDTQTEPSYWVTITLSDGKKEKSYINNGAAVLKGWQTIGGKRYYFDTNGLLWTQEKGWFISGRNLYYFNEDGSVYQGFLEQGASEVYYLNTNGLLLKGWQTIKENGISRKYYFDPTSGKAWMGHQKIGNYWYYFDPENHGAMAVGYIRDKEGDGYYYNAKGIRQTGWQKTDGQWRYFDPSDARERQVEVDENYWATITFETGTERAFIRNGNSVLKGWQTINGKRYYFDANGFQWTEEKGWLVIRNNWYYFDESQNDSVHQGFLELNGHTYYLNGNGQALKGWQTVKVDGASRKY